LFPNKLIFWFVLVVSVRRNGIKRENVRKRSKKTRKTFFESKKVFAKKSTLGTWWEKGEFGVCWIVVGGKTVEDEGVYQIYALWGGGWVRCKVRAGKIGNMGPCLGFRILFNLRGGSDEDDLESSGTVGIIGVGDRRVR
jgi:hypothetical protein